MKDIHVRIHKRMEKSRTRYGWPGTNCAENGFRCISCQGFVHSEPGLSSVRNRNHCPYCLWSRHLDLHAAGDRLSACKSPMQPIGLTIKHTCKKYGTAGGELMLIHSCMECKALSINRIAADDIPDNLFAVFEGSFQVERAIHDKMKNGGIRLLEVADRPLVLRLLFGNECRPADGLFQGCSIGTG